MAKRLCINARARAGARYYSIHAWEGRFTGSSFAISATGKPMAQPTVRRVSTRLQMCGSLYTCVSNSRCSLAEIHFRVGQTGLTTFSCQSLAPGGILWSIPMATPPPRKQPRFRPLIVVDINPAPVKSRSFVRKLLDRLNGRNMHPYPPGYKPRRFLKAKKIPEPYKPMLVPRILSRTELEQLRAQAQIEESTRLAELRKEQVRQQVPEELRQQAAAMLQEHVKRMAARKIFVEGQAAAAKRRRR